MMEALIIADTILVILISLLMVGLLRSHAEILRRLRPAETEEEEEEGAAPAPTVNGLIGLQDLPAPRPDQTPAADVAGQTLSGDGVKISVGTGRGTLLAFLSSGCGTCLTFWEGIAGGGRLRLPAETRAVIVVKDPAYESPSRLRELAGDSAVPVVMSSAAWDAYKVTQYPYFIYVDGPSGEVQSEGTAGSWSQVASLLRDAIGDYQDFVTRTGTRRLPQVPLLGRGKS